MNKIIPVLAALAVLCAVAPVRADYSKASVGYVDLLNQLGAGIPTGDGVHAAMVESSATYIPNLSHSQLIGKTVIGQTGTSTGSSTHSTLVARNFFGNPFSGDPSASGRDSIAPDLGNDSSYPILAYRSSNNANTGWLGTGYLQDAFVHTGTTYRESTFNHTDTTFWLPPAVDTQVVNHSYVATGPQDELWVNSFFLRRMDFLVEALDQIQVVGVENSSGPAGSSTRVLWNSAFNVISVGRSSGSHTWNTVAADPDNDPVYTAGRNAPHIVAPESQTSYATPIVSAAAALLLETAGKGGLSLSNGKIYNDYFSERQIFHGETSEVIKAVLMAGADRTWSAGYIVNKDNNTSNRYGAGRLNIFHSYNIMAAGEQDSLQDGNALVSGTNVDRKGWDYDPAFGGAGGSNSTASYYFHAGSDPGQFTATLAWNLRVQPWYDSNANVVWVDYTSQATLYNLDLALYDVTGGNVLVQSSFSTNENTENIYVTDLTANHIYELRVTAVDGPFLWDYAVAWNLIGTDEINQPIPEPSSFLLAVVGIVAVVFIRRRRSR